MSLDIRVETTLVNRIRAMVPPYPIITVTPYHAEETVQMPRIVVQSQAQDTPEFRTVGIYRCEVTIEMHAEGADDFALESLAAMSAAVNNIIDHPAITELLSSPVLRIHGAIPGASEQTIESERMIRRRSLQLWAQSLVSEGVPIDIPFPTFLNEVNEGSGGDSGNSCVSEAPQDGTAYVRVNGGWLPTQIDFGGESEPTTVPQFSGQTALYDGGSKIKFGFRYGDEFAWSYGFIDSV